ncbi:hypothetical protein [Acinetobacter baumannii]|uniref:hypothetical protein n=1 Tax=Acinetobacter baumannii TaxID=470 RepID=UPI003891C35F
MMTFLNFITTYSSAIQTLCAILGLILGISAIVFAKHQINISQKQRLFQLAHDYAYDNTNILIQVENIETRIQLTIIDINEAIDDQEDDDLKVQLQNKIKDLKDLTPDLVKIKEYFKGNSDRFFLDGINLTIEQLEKTLTERMKALNFIAVANRTIDKIIRLNDAMIKLEAKKKQIDAKINQLLEKLNSPENDSSP